jgi:hypothetical protein
VWEWLAEVVGLEVVLFEVLYAERGSLGWRRYLELVSTGCGQYASEKKGYGHLSDIDPDTMMDMS